ncbi:MAG TPA: ATP-binding protein, partial [Coleofasciculaceae cyanobacterium]
SRVGIQIYMATHSYFVIKQFELLARRNKTSIQLCSLKKGGDIGVSFSDLQLGMPDNPIIEASIKLYEEDVRLDFES